jgi:sterol desaturase/sphingolipid hydroxylase (fatty acid hydroxylase superfamily)
VRFIGLHIIWNAIQLGWALPAVLALELLWPLETRPSWFSRLRATSMWGVYLLISAVILALNDYAMGAVNIRPLFGSLSPIPAAICAVVLWDFLYYWCHRAQHRWLWRFHAVHHSLRELSGINSYHHWTEQLIRIPLVIIPVALLAPPGARSPLIGILVVLQTYYLHAATKLHFGPLRRVIADNRFHRLHHSLELEHFDRNFSATFPLWDVLFGTVRWPKAGEWPATGVADIAEPDTTMDYLTGPFREPRFTSPVQATSN